MTLPANLQKQFETALAVMRNQSEFDLGLDCRLAVYDNFDALPRLKGRIARTHLSIVVAKQVLPFWDSMPEEHGYLTMPRLMISTAEQLLSYMEKGTPAEQLGNLAREITVEVVYGTEIKPIETYTQTALTLAQLAAEMDSLTGELPASLHYHPWCVFLTAMNALREALGWKWWSGDVTGLAAKVYAGGTWSPFEEQDPSYFAPQGTWTYSTPEVQAKRYTFWEWWCKEAVPTAWEAQSDLE